MANLDSWTDEFDVFFGSNELQSPATLMRNELGFSHLHLSSQRQSHSSNFRFEGKVLEKSGQLLSFSLKILEPKITYEDNRFICFLELNSQSTLRIGDTVNSEYPFEKKMLSSHKGEMTETELRHGIVVDFHLLPASIDSQSTLHIFHIFPNGDLHCCGSINSGAEYADAADSLGDSDSLDQITSFDINELDHYNYSPPKYSDNLSRKRSFLNREENDTTTAGSFIATDDLYPNSFSQSNGLKKLKSARNLQRQVLIQRQSQKVSPIISRSSAFSSVSSLSRCASAPAIKMRAALSQSKEIFSVLKLFTDISTNNSESRFVGVLTKFILSDKETLTKLIQKELSFCSRPEKLFSLCYLFIKRNFPPFEDYCAKIDNFEEAAIEKALIKLNEQQFSDISMELSESNDFQRFQGPWKVLKERKKNILEFYKKLEFTEIVSSCYTAINSILNIRYDTVSNSFIIDKEEKLFSQSKQRYFADGQKRNWKICNPLLQEDQSFTSYLCSTNVEKSQFSIEKVVKGNKLKMKETFEIGENGELEITYCLYKANVKDDEEWTLVYSTLVLFEKM